MDLSAHSSYDAWTRHKERIVKGKRLAKFDQGIGFKETSRCFLPNETDPSLRLVENKEIPAFRKLDVSFLGSWGYTAAGDFRNVAAIDSEGFKSFNLLNEVLCQAEHRQIQGLQLV